MSSPSKQRSLLIPAPPTGNAASTQKLTFANTAPNGKKQKLPQNQQQQQQHQPEYMRLADAQARALEKFTLQQHQWDDISRAVADKSHKLESATLASTTFLFREKMEETGKLDAAVPPAARSHASNSWEMGLRNGTSATRYEPVGSSFPYPLYCPIRSPDQVSSEHPYLTHILYPPNVTGRVSKRDIHSKPIMESQFFKSRQAEFAHHINKKFAHFQATEYFDVHGGPAPRTNERVDESAPQPSVQFIPMESKDGTSGLIDPASATHATTIRNLIAQQQLQQTAVNNLNMASNNNSMAQQQQVAPLNAVSNTNNNNNAKQQQQQSVGPQIVLSTNNLSFTTSSPDEMKQAIVTLDNTGSTAIYYQWAALPAAPPVTVQGLPGGIENNANESQQVQQDLSGISLQNNNNNNNNSTPSAQMSSPFSLANPVTGSILPESMKMFCFSFKAKAPGIYTQHMELITVPSGRERIVVTLRGVSLSSDADPVICGSIEEDLNQKCQIAMAEEILKGDIIHKSRENAFTVSDVAVSVKKRENEIQAEKDAPKKLRAERKILWQKANKTMVTVNNTTQPAHQQPVSSNMDHVILNPKDAKKAAAAAALAHSTAFGDQQQQSAPLASARENNNEAAPVASSTTPRHSTAVNLHEVENTHHQSRNQNPENKTLLPFCESAYAALEGIRRRCNEFRDEFESEVGPSKSRLRQQAQILEASASKKGKDGSGATPRGKRGDDEDQEPPPDRAVQLVGSVPAKWNGSLRSLYEDVSVVRTNKVRSTATEAVSAIHRALIAYASVPSTSSSTTATSSSSSSLDTTSLSDIMWLSAGRSWLGNAFDKFERASILAAARIENRATCISKGINVYGVPPKKGAGGGASSGVGERASTPVHALGADLNAPATNFSGGGASASAAASNRRGPAAAAAAAAQTALNNANNAANKSTATSQESAEDIRQLKEESIKQLLLGAISGMISTHDNNMDLVEAATCLPLSSLVIDEAAEVVEGRDMEAEPLLDLNTKKRK